MQVRNGSVCRGVLLVLAILSIRCSDGSPVAPGPPGAETDLLRELAAGRYVIFFRHTERDGAVLSTPDLALADSAGRCVPGSELTAKGIADAQAIREALIRNRIGVHEVYASPTCRTTQMADLLVGRFTTTRALTWPDMWHDGEGASLTTELRRLLGTVPPSRRNTVLVSHSNVLTADRIGTDVALGQGDAAIFRPRGGARFELVGVLPLQRWVDARAPLGYNAAP